MKLLMALGLAGSVLGLADQAGAIEIAPHRAVYDLTLDRTSEMSGVADMSGTMSFEWADACDGWTVTQRSLMSFTYRTGEQLDVAWTLVSWEAKDSLRYRFFVRKLENGELTSELRGDARLDGLGETGVAQYRLPEERTVPLPAGTLFPTAHSLKLLQEAEAGRKLFWAEVFDGSDEEGLFGVNAAVGDRRGVPEAKPQWPLLAAGPSWHVDLAFFSMSDQTAAPEHEQHLRLHPNGVVDELTLDYGDFRIAAKVRNLETLTSPPC